MTIRSTMRLCFAFVVFAAVIVLARPARAQITDFGPGPWGPNPLNSNNSLVTIATDYVRANGDSPHHTAGLAYCDRHPESESISMSGCRSKRHVFRSLPRCRHVLDLSALFGWRLVPVGLVDCALPVRGLLPDGEDGRRGPGPDLDYQHPLLKRLRSTIRQDEHCALAPAVR